MSVQNHATVLQRQLLLQFGDRLRRLRKERKMSAVEMAQRVGISRMTLSSVEAGDPGPSIGTYLRVMAELGIGGDLALLAGDVLSPAPADSAAGRSRRDAPQVRITVATDTALHRAQDLQSLVLHKEAIKFIRENPDLKGKAFSTLDAWLDKGHSRSMPLWLEWKDILRLGQWSKVLRRTRRAQELRQASPLLSVLPEEERLRILKEVSALKKGVQLSHEERPDGAP